MNTPGFVRVFPRQLRYWALHSSVNALPSFAIALFFLQLWKRPFAVCGMIAAIATVVFIYAIVTSAFGSFSNRDHLFARSLHLALKIRLWIVSISLVLVATRVGLLYTPDFWCGFAANQILEAAARVFGRSSYGFDVSNQAGQTFLPVFAVTLLEGLILSAILMLISFFAIIFLQARDRRKHFEGGFPTGREKA